MVAPKAAVNALLDRAYGKPVKTEEGDVVDLPPVVIQLTEPLDDPQSHQSE